MSFLNPESILTSIGIFEAGMQAADFGCGAGYFTLPLSRIVGEEGKVFAVDIQESALETVRGKTSRANINNVKTIRADLEKFGSTAIDSGLLNAIILATILFQSEKKEEILKEAKRALAEDGYLIIIEWEPNASMGPEGYKIGKEQARQLAEQNGFHFEKEFNVDGYHYGLLFQS